MKSTLKRIALGAMTASLIGGPALADDLCATSDQRQAVEEFLADKTPMMPIMAARELKLPEAIVASAYPDDYVASASAEAFDDIWTAMTKLDKVTVLITKGPHVYEVSSGIGAGTRSDTTPFFNLDHDNAFSGHLMPEMLSSISAVAVPGEEGKVGRGIFFYMPNGEPAFGTLISGNGPSPSADEIAKFDGIMAMIKARPSACTN